MINSTSSFFPAKWDPCVTWSKTRVLPLVGLMWFTYCRCLRKHLKCHFLQIELNNWLLHILHWSIKVSLVTGSVEPLIYVFLSQILKVRTNFPFICRWKYTIHTNPRIEYFLRVYFPSLTRYQGEIHVTTFDCTQERDTEVSFGSNFTGRISVFIHTSPSERHRDVCINTHKCGSIYVNLCM